MRSAAKCVPAPQRCQRGATLGARAAAVTATMAVRRGSASGGCVVAQPIRLRTSDEFARLLLDHGADPNARASLRKQLRGVDDESLHEYRDVTPLSWGERFHDQDFVSKPAMRLIAACGGHG